jgi:hypothetical protein
MCRNHLLIESRCDGRSPVEAGRFLAGVEITMAQQPAQVSRATNSMFSKVDLPHRLS